jgi:hypothetical protein
LGAIAVIARGSSAGKNQRIRIGGRVPSTVLLYVASALCAIWGVAHLFATRGVVSGFGEISIDNKRVITMEWIVEGIALISIGAFVATATWTDAASLVSRGVYAVAILALLVLALVSLLTGFKIAFLPYRLCPFIFGLSALPILVGGLL